MLIGQLPVVLSILSAAGLAHKSKSFEKLLEMIKIDRWRQSSAIAVAGSTWFGE